jgi:glycosyltransferase involved in cell wall biosynthesis
LPEPLVSVCIPTYNSGRWIAETVTSALGQTYPNIDVLVADNGSSDDTEAIVRSFDDPRLRFEPNLRELGMVRNHNWLARQARAPLIKYLHADDALAPTAVERLVEVALRSDRIGLVFAPRRVVLEPPDEPAALAWEASYGNLHSRFGPLEAVNPGRPMFERWLSDALAERDFENWVGEPSSVLIRRTALERVGLFNPRLSMLMDAEMWGRLSFFFDVGFVDEELSTYRHHAGSVTSYLAATHASWLDRLWLFEGLLAHPEIASAHPTLRRARRAEYRWAARAIAGRVGHLRPLRLADLRAYAVWRWSGRPEPLHPDLARA